MSAKVLYLLAITTLTVSAKALAMEAPSAIAVNQNDQEILLREKAMYGSNEVQDISGNTLDISEPQIEEEAGVVDSIFGKGTQERIVQSVNNWVAQKAKTNPGCIERFICESYKSSESMSGIPYLAMSVSNAAVSFYVAEMFDQSIDIQEITRAARYGRTIGSCDTMKCDFVDGQLRTIGDYLSSLEDFITSIVSSVSNSINIGKK
ncbi:hypothetical protein TCAL_00916 [Tigriopus californicus]|uniref:Uncharacterized protein n=1 Tax=Tigriopus californicus TaxID=6832 RepID=A0A553P7P7_TIGCA|nr:uncharacterized protein LOC131878423 [Tigriopus californicus]TRY73704.1 hypothetical protein TCAL_00916 [Tigriopus californicus]|eukprot:TCALIF_00916-PA protein Name:"Protein of unknown function" AED:0.00 eAED:0.00 QI:231/1/1/1/0.75/0.8/5/302/205